MNENKKDVNGRNKIIVFIGGACLLLFLGILILVMVSKSIKDIEIFENANFVEVEATIVDYKEQKDYIQSYYITFYEYKSPNGGIYSGFWQTKIKTEEEAKAQIGMEVPLYVDEELHLQTRSLETDKTGVIIGVIFGSVCLLGSIVLIVKLLVQLAHWLKKKSNLEGVQYEKENKTSKPKNFCTLNLAIMLFTIFATIGCIGSSISKENSYQKYSNAEFVEVAGEIYEYKEFEKDNSPYYALFYKYISANGGEYAGVWEHDINTKEDAEAAIGSKVPLFYDKDLGVLKSMSDLEPISKPDHKLNIILAVVFAILFVNSLARFIRFIIRNERYKKQHREDSLNGSQLE